MSHDFVGYVGKVGVKRRLPFPSFKVVVFQQAQVEYFINLTYVCQNGSIMIMRTIVCGYNV